MWSQKAVWCPRAIPLYERRAILLLLLGGVFMPPPPLSSLLCWKRICTKRELTPEYRDELRKSYGNGSGLCRDSSFGDWSKCYLTKINAATGAKKNIYIYNKINLLIQFSDDMEQKQLNTPNAAVSSDTQQPPTSRLAECILARSKGRSRGPLHKRRDSSK